MWVVGGTVGLHFDTFLLLGNDDVAGVPANVDDIVEISRGEVVEVARLMLLQRALPTFGVVAEPT
jgi:hypothetical protein